jgi:hypothetical protein
MTQTGIKVANCASPWPDVTGTGFSVGSEARVMQTGEGVWRLLKGFSYTGRSQTFDVPEGQCTDFASVPRIFVWLLPRYGRYTLPAILHDHLWRDLVPAKKLTYVEADGILRRAMRELGVPFLKRWTIWAAVRWGALKKGGLSLAWMKESPRVLLVTFAVAPVVFPAAAVVLVSLAAYWVIETLAWLVLSAFTPLTRTEDGQERKPNRPRLTWKV